ncbi:hypothetical protein V1505DRAFT_381486, partial [Lipomyces doorenjongii]
HTRTASTICILQARRQEYEMFCLSRTHLTSPCIICTSFLQLQSDLPMPCFSGKYVCAFFIVRLSLLCGCVLRSVDKYV